MSSFIQRPFAGTVTGLALPVALKTPPSSIGRQLMVAPVSAAIFGSCVQARYAVGLPTSKKYSTVRFVSLIARSPGFHPGPQVELVRPRALVLAVQVPVVVGDRLGAEDSALL